MIEIYFCRAVEVISKALKPDMRSHPVGNDLIFIVAKPKFSGGLAVKSIAETSSLSSKSPEGFWHCKLISCAFCGLQFNVNLMNPSVNNDRNVSFVVAYQHELSVHSNQYLLWMRCNSCTNQRTKTQRSGFGVDVMQSSDYFFRGRILWFHCQCKEQQMQVTLQCCRHTN